jgi:hypothetical protein
VRDFWHILVAQKESVDTRNRTELINLDGKRQMRLQRNMVPMMRCERESTSDSQNKTRISVPMIAQDPETS